MNFSSVSFQEIWQVLGWTMILFLAAGTVVLLSGAALRVVLKRANPTIRYTTSLAIFAALALLPLAIAVSLTASSPTNPTRERGELTTNLTNGTNPDLNTEVAESAKFAEASRLTTEIPEYVNREAERGGDERAAATRIDIIAIMNQTVAYLPWLWCIGTPLTFLLLATGLAGAERLRRSCDMLTDGPIRAACDELSTTLGIGQRVDIAICDCIATPLLVGVVRSLILLPPAALNGWTTAELEMVLVHELAHVRRWDNAVNLVQRIVESLLFFHPAVWIVSGWVRRDREDCCDAAVIRHTAKPHAYAELLLALASSTPGLAASAALAEHPVASRIRRILKLEDEPMLVTRKGLFVGVSTVVVAALLAFALPTSDAEEAPDTVSREAERVADERSETTNPTREQGEKQTTNQTNDPKEDLNAESAKSAEDADNSLTEYTTAYDLKGTKYAELLDHLRGTGEFRMTSNHDNQVVVTARRSLHKRVADFLTSISKQPQQATNNSQRPLVYAEQTEELPGGTYKYSFLVPWVRAVNDPVRRATTETLIKSDMLLSRALKEMNLFEGAQPSVMDYLRKELSVHYSPDGHMFVALTGAEDGEAAVAAYAAPIINEYLKEHFTHLAQNQHDLATKDVQLDLATTDLRPDVGETTNGRNQALTTQETEEVSPRAAPELAKVLESITPQVKESKHIDWNLIDGPPGRLIRLVQSESPGQAAEQTTNPTNSTNQANDKEGADSDPSLPKLKKFTFTKTTPVSEIQSFVEFLKSQEGLEVSITKNDDGTITVVGTALIDPTHVHPFPTLEEQRAADLAYKLLGMELEKLGKEELERVKAKGYEGGLRVTNAMGIDAGRGAMPSPLINGDILVGLHVWPTKSLQEVNEILTRDDLDQLSPLKFYVIRSMQQIGGGYGEAMMDPAAAGPQPDEVINGRIQVDVEAWRAMRKPMLQQLVALEKEIQEELAEKEKLRDDGTAKDRVMLDAEIEQLRDILKQLGKKTAIRTSQEKVNTATGIIPLYDGKTFDEWRDLWKSELKTEKRTECIRALAAFGRAGQGKEAAEAILDVAAEYDYSPDPNGIRDDSAEGKLKERIMDELTAYQKRLPERDWLPVLKERLGKEPAKYKGLTAQMLPRLFTTDPIVKPILKQLQQSEDQAIRQAALSTIFISQQVYSEEETDNLIQAVLAEEPVTAIRVLDQRLLNHVSIEQAVGFLLSENEEVQLATRKAMRLFFDEEKGPQLAKELLAVLNDTNRQQNHLAAVRALAALRFHAKAAEPALTRIIESTKDEELMVAAVFAREMVTLERNHSRSTITNESKDAIKKSNRWPDYVSDESKLNEAFRAEAAQVTGEQSMQFGGGGGMGGGGMF
jgi:beta-lactamase regulating signal transducer with metallopeptidase domain